MVIRLVDNLFVVKIFKEYLDGVDIYDKDNIVTLFKEILIRLSNRYKINGLYDVFVYVNDDYGIIMEFENVYGYDDEVDINIVFNLDCIFLYESNDVDRGNTYYYDGKYYSDVIDYDSNVIYKNSSEIINKGIKIH